jgi:hypothetical protein
MRPEAVQVGINDAVNGICNIDDKANNLISLLSEP